MRLTTRDGRTVWPSGRLYFMPRMRPVMPATLMIAPLAMLPSIVGSTISLAVHPMCVRWPWYEVLLWNQNLEKTRSTASPPRSSNGQSSLQADKRAKTPDCQ